MQILSLESLHLLALQAGSPLHTGPRPRPLPRREAKCPLASRLSERAREFAHPRTRGKFVTQWLNFNGETATFKEPSLDRLVDLLGE